MTTEKNRNGTWISGEELLQSGLFDLPALVQACNDGRCQIFDDQKQVTIIPTTRLKRIKRKYNAPTTFTIPLFYNNDGRTITACRFKKPKNKIWSMLFAQHLDCWQAFERYYPPYEWHFNIPDQLSDYDEITRLGLHEKKRYALTFEETSQMSGPGIWPDPNKAESQSECSGEHETATSNKQMHIWFKRLNEDNDMPIDITILTIQARSVNL